ncbi:hypothetical protein CKO11_11820 [Rhodobacter sp. TJ_12]|uniref:hypothetical protein n=1 Tax=Rhodobacter sp. TJ_12 TaxID=2029399 RepID=UPI001CC1A183|nr:hypothetical protein [Rhodobacter sp. TJ_12]MBZ4023147.1 hypothetical protein [Rhodobacter sp. TJ_12]
MSYSLDQEFPALFATDRSRPSLTSRCEDHAHQASDARWPAGWWIVPALGLGLSFWVGLAVILF